MLENINSINKKKKLLLEDIDKDLKKDKNNKKNDKDNEKNNNDKDEKDKNKDEGTRVWSMDNKSPKLHYYDFFDKTLRDLVNKKFPLKIHYVNSSTNTILNDDENKEEKENKKPKIPEKDKIFMKIEEKVDNISDIIKIAKKYSEFIETHKFSVDMNTLKNLIEPLEKINNVIGMNDIKTQLVDQLLSSLQGLYDDDHKFHTIIQGPPGVGKTMLAKLLGQVYLKMGILKNRFNRVKFKIATRSDLIGKFLGHTAKQTQDFIDSCEGGVLFIDEVYSLGNAQKRDSFAKECIDTLNMNLTEKDNFVCIIAGYPEEIETCFFSYNPGLRRRFHFIYSIEKYNPDELSLILISKIKIAKWKLEDDIYKNNNLWLNNFMEKNIDYFPHFGGDIDTLILKCKTVHGRRIFGKEIDLKKVLTKEDIKNGFDLYKKSRKNKKKKNLVF